jgi:hypothetical protein
MATTGFDGRSNWSAFGHLKGLTAGMMTGRVLVMDERRSAAATFKVDDETTAVPWDSSCAPCVVSWFWYGFTYIPPAELEGWVSPMR